MTPVRKFISSAAVVATIAASIILTFTLARQADGYVEAAPIVAGDPPAP